MHGMGEEELGSLLSTMEGRIYEPGDRILEEGTPSDGLFFLADGPLTWSKVKGSRAF